VSLASCVKDLEALRLLDRFLEVAGLDCLLEVAGLDRFLEVAGLDRLLEMTGLDRLLEVLVIYFSCSRVIF